MKTNKLLLSKFVDVDLFMDSDVKLNLTETVNLISHKQIELKSEMLCQPETKVLIKMVKSLNEELDMLQEMTSQACFTLNKVSKERDETVERMNSLEKLVIELKREIEQYWGG